MGAPDDTRHKAETIPSPGLCILKSIYYVLADKSTAYELEYPSLRKSSLPHVIIARWCVELKSWTLILSLAMPNDAKGLLSTIHSLWGLISGALSSSD